MIILGSKYKFNFIEKEKIKKIFTLHYINDSDENKAKKEILTILNQETKKIILLNSNKTFSKDFIEFLSKLELQGIEYLNLEEFMEKYLYKMYIPLDGKNINFLQDLHSYNKHQYFIKRFIDYSISIPLLIIASPIMLLAAYKIKKESPEGPIIFKQKRVGLNGEEFVCYKFRSMVPDAEKGKPQFASEDDPRIFKWGAFMRKTRIDELPQIWNVLKGEMHMIGPRPERKYWVDKFKKTIPFYDERHLIKPGITGWAQVNYPYGDGEEDAYQKLMYDLYYIKNWSLSLEIKTIFKTAMVMIGRKGL